MGIVSTSATIENKLYENSFAENNIGYKTPDALQQAKMGKFIVHLVNGQQNNKDREELILIINDFEKKDVDCVVLACTDLQLLIPKHPSLQIFDTMKIFVDATVEELLKMSNWFLKHLYTLSWIMDWKLKKSYYFYNKTYQCF